MAIQFGERRYRLTGITPILGSQPANPAIRTQFVASKAPDPALGEDENAMLPEDVEGKGLTVFLQRDQDNALCLMDYMVVGYFKESMNRLKSQLNIAQAKSKVEAYVFVEPREIPILRNGEIITDCDSVLERPLRAQTMQGPRVTLAASEQIDDPWTIEFTVKLIGNPGTKTSAPITWEAIETALDYGSICGALGQWRNGGYGRFRWERVDSIKNAPAV